MLFLEMIGIALLGFIEKITLFKETSEILTSYKGQVTRFSVSIDIKNVKDSFQFVFFFLPELNLPSNKTTNALKERNDLPSTSSYKTLGLYNFVKCFRRADKRRGPITELKKVFQNKLHSSADQNTF